MSALVVVAGLTACITALMGLQPVALAAAGITVILIAAAPRCMRSRLRSRGGTLAISGASVAFARNNRRGVRHDRGDILDGWFTVEQYDELSEDTAAIPRQRRG